MTFGTERNKPKRNPFPDEPFFFVPIPLYESGLARTMSGTQFKRYVTLLRLANYDYGNPSVRLSMKQLEELDGVSGRAAYEARGNLEEWGMIVCDRTRPITYRLCPPGSWKLPDSHPALSKSQSRTKVTNKLNPVEWK